MKRFLLLSAILFLMFTLEAQKNKKYPEMVFVKGGSFMMGSNEGYDDEKPIHKVILDDFYISKYEITVAQYREFCKATGHKFPDKPDAEWYQEHKGVKKWEWIDNHPIVNVTWYDAMEYCKWLSKITGDEYSLPTEAQWEYAARGGQKSHGYKYAGSNNINEVAWYDETTYERGTQPVGLLKPNELGLYDMSGNATEWCLDGYGPYPNKTLKNPVLHKKSKYKVVRGGNWYYVDEFCRVTERDGPKPTEKKFVYGFRVVKKAK